MKSWTSPLLSRGEESAMGRWEKRLTKSRAEERTVLFSVDFLACCSVVVVVVVVYEEERESAERGGDRYYESESISS